MRHFFCLPVTNCNGYQNVIALVDQSNPSQPTTSMGLSPLQEFGVDSLARSCDCSAKAEEALLCDYADFLRQCR